MNREMKDSGYSWMKNIPVSWSIYPIKYLFSILSGSTPDSTVPGYWDGDVPWITPADFKTKDYTVSVGHRNLTAEGVKSCSTTKVPAGSVIFSKRAPIGTVAINAVELYTNQGCLSCVPYRGTVSKYYYYVMSIYEDVFNLYGSGTTFKEISATVFGNVLLPYPSDEEQYRIADFLDKKCSQIDEISKKIQEEINTLEEYKKSVITEAVTKGLDPNVEMKDSGIEWLGFVPGNWNITRVKYCLKEIDDRSVSGLEEPLSMSQRYGIIPTAQIDVPHIMASYVGAKICNVNDLILNKLKAHLGVFSTTKYRGLVSPDYAVYRANTNVNPKFLEYLFKTDKYINEFKKHITGVGQGLSRLYTKDLFSISVSLPEKVEQDQIVEISFKLETMINHLVETKQQQLSTLEKYKKSLIYEYVTGKKEVAYA